MTVVMDMLKGTPDDPKRTHHHPGRNLVAMSAKKRYQSPISLPDPGTDKAYPHSARSITELTFGELSPRKCPEDFHELREAFTRRSLRKKRGMPHDER